MPKRLILTIIYLRANTILTAISILLTIAHPERHVKDGSVIFFLAASFAFVFEATIQGLKMLKFWAWVVAFFLCSTFLFSLFAPLAGLGLWGLLDSESRAAFLRLPGNSA